MPTVQLPSFNAFGFFPLQLNPHYKNETIEGFNGETRNQRIHEFFLYNHQTLVAGLPGVTALQLLGDQITFLGHEQATRFWIEDKHDLKMKQLQNKAPVLW